MLVSSVSRQAKGGAPRRAVVLLCAMGALTAISCGKAGDAPSAPGPSGLPVAFVRVTPDTGSVETGSTLQLTAVPLDPGGLPLTRSVAVSWSSSDPSRATVSASGLVSGVLPGDGVLVTATAEGRSGSARLSVRQPRVAAVLVSLGANQLRPQQSTQAVAAMRDAAGNALNGRLVSWASSNQAVATVSTTGLVTAVSPGTVLITAVSEGIAGAATLTVTPPPVTSVEVALSASATFPGTTVQASATLRDASGAALTGRSVVWTSSNQQVATVSSSGLVTALAPGSAVITATSEGTGGSATLIVSAPPVAVVEVTSAQTTLTIGGTTQVNATLRDAAGSVLTERAISWTTSNAATATVSTTGLVAAVSPGTVTITAASEGKAGSITLTILAAAPAFVTVSPATITLTPGQSTSFTATVRDAAQNVLTNQAVTWSSSNPTIAAANPQSGQVTAVSAGTAAITATSSGRSGVATVIVSAIPVASVTLNAASLSLVAGDVRVLIATARDAAGNILTGRSVSWTSTNLNVVDGFVFADTAVITGLTAGSATVSASVEGRSASAVVTVVAPSASVCSAIAGAAVFGDDGQFLGRFTNRFDSQSVLNQFGNYGSPYSSTSTNNTYGQYGSPYSSLSARSPYATRPPTIVKNGQAIGYYTMNQFKTPGVSPAYAMTCTFP